MADISHIDQLTFIARYLSPEGNIVECFLEFLAITSHTRESLFKSVLNELGIDINNCPGQCYDNTSNIYKGVQSRIREVNPLAEWVPCAAHTLNLVWINTVNCCFETKKFFTFVQTLFNFCSRLSSRWRVITSGLEANENKWTEKIKSLSDTLWSMHALIMKVLCYNYANIKWSLICLRTTIRIYPHVTKLECWQNKWTNWKMLFFANTATAYFNDLMQLVKSYKTLTLISPKLWIWLQDWEDSFKTAYRESEHVKNMQMNQIYFIRNFNCLVDRSYCRCFFMW